MIEVTEQERAGAVRYWAQHIAGLQGAGLPDDVMAALGMMTAADNIGYEQGEIRPGDLGKWDVYELCKMWGFAEAHCLLASGLSAAELKIENDRMTLESAGVDPDDPRAVREYHAVNAMSPGQLDAQLGLSPVAAVVPGNDAANGYDDYASPRRGSGSYEHD